MANIRDFYPYRAMDDRADQRRARSISARLVDELALPAAAGRRS